MGNTLTHVLRSLSWDNDLVQNNINYIYCEKQGVSKARNVGIKSAGKEFRRITKEIKELDDDFAWLAGVLANALDYDFSNLTIALHNDFHNYLNGAAGLLASIDNGVAQVAANTA